METMHYEFASTSEIMNALLASDLRRLHAGQMSRRHPVPIRRHAKILPGNLAMGRPRIVSMAATKASKPAFCVTENRNSAIPIDMVTSCVDTDASGVNADCSARLISRRRHAEHPLIPAGRHASAFRRLGNSFFAWQAQYPGSVDARLRQVWSDGAGAHSRGAARQTRPELRGNGIGGFANPDRLTGSPRHDACVGAA